MLSEVFKKKTVPLYKHKRIYITLVYQININNLVSKQKILQANGDSIAKVSIEGW